MLPFWTGSKKMWPYQILARRPNRWCARIQYYQNLGRFARPAPKSLLDSPASIRRFLNLGRLLKTAGPSAFPPKHLRFKGTTAQRNDGKKDDVPGGLFPTCFDGMSGRPKRGIANKGSVLSLVAFTLFAGKLSSAEAAKFLGNGSRA